MADQAAPGQPTGYRSAQTVEVSAAALRRAVIELLLVLLIPPLSELVELLQGCGAIPVLWRVPWM